jgi:rubredoxin
VIPDEAPGFPWDLHPREVVCPECRLTHHESARACPNCGPDA